MKITVKCAICGKEFESCRLNAKYCSPECRARANSDKALDCYRRKKAGFRLRNMTMRQRSVLFAAKNSSHTVLHS